MTVLLARNGLFRPAAPILAAQYDASLLSAGTVSTWPDASGNGHDLATGVAPTCVANIQNSLPVVRFTGTQWLKLIGPNVDGSVPWISDFSLTVLLVYIRRTAVNNSGPMSIWNAANSNDFGPRFEMICGFEGASAAIVQSYRGGAGPSVTHPGNNVAMLATHTARDPTNTIALNASSNSAPVNASNWRDIAAQNLYVGCRYDKAANATDGSSTFYNGDICEIRIYRGWMPAATLTAIQAALKAKWGTP